MFIEVLDQFRCTSPHEQSWLVASFSEREDRFIVRGTFGCHICLRQFPIERGIAYFGSEPQPYAETTPLVGDPETAMRAAAFLNATERATLVVAGTWAKEAHELVKILPMRVFAMNPGGVIQESEMVTVFESNEGIPLAEGSVHGIALDTETATPATLRSVGRMLRPGGRIIAPVSVIAPPDISILARDDSFWVGEKTEELVTLRRS